MEVLAADKAMLEERLEATGARLAETQAALNTAARDVAALQARRGISKGLEWWDQLRMVEGAFISLNCAHKCISLYVNVRARFTS